jgi:hypothetical protein
MRKAFALLLYLIIAINSFAQQETNMLYLMRPESLLISPIYTVGVAYYRLSPQAMLVDSARYKSGKISQISGYSEGIRVKDKFYDTLGRIVKQVQYSPYKIDSSKITTADTWEYKADETDSLHFTYSLPPWGNYIKYKSTTTKKANGSELTIANNYFAHSTRDSLRIYREHNKLIYQEHYIDGKLTEWEYRKYYPNGELSYSEDQNSFGKHIQTFNEKGQPLKDDWNKSNGENDFTTYEYNSKGKLKSKIHDNPGGESDSTFFIYDKKGSVVKQASWFGFPDTNKNYRQTTLITYDKKERRVMACTEYWKDTTFNSRTFFRYENEGKNYATYYADNFEINDFNERKNLQGLADRWTFKSYYQFKGDTIITTNYSVKKNVVLSYACLTDDSIYQPAIKTIDVPKKFHLQCNYREGKWDTVNWVKYDSRGKISDQFENPSFFPCDTNYHPGKYRCHCDYNVAGKCIRARIVSDSGLVVFDYRAKYNSRGQLTVLDCKYDRGERKYDSLTYDSLGRITGEYYLYHGKPAALLYEYKSTNFKSSKCTKRIDGKETILWETVFENEKMKKGKETASEIC